jgi:putative FmdB family regulatory protein
MPLYEYRCRKCDRKFALLVGVTAQKQGRACPHCGSRQLTKLISRIAPVARDDDFDTDEFDDDFKDDGDLDDYDDLED